MKRFGTVLAFILILASSALCADINGNQILTKWMTAERTAKYIADEVTILQGYGGLKSRETVYHDGLNGSRIEYTFPAKMKGTVIVDNGKQSVFYSPNEGKMTVGPSRLAMMKKRPAGRQSPNWHINAELKGREKIAGRNAYVIESRFKFNPRKYGKVWIDDKKWVRLKSQELSADGKVLSSSFYTNIRFVKNIPASMFTIKPKQGVKIEQMRSPWLMPLAQASKSVEFGAIEPDYVPAGYKQIGAIVVPFRQGRILGIRYSNGTKAFTIFESSDDVMEPRFLRKLHQGPVKSEDETYTFRAKGLNITIIGQINSSEMAKIANSMK